MLVAKSNISPNAGEGAFAIRDIPTNTFFSLYGGMLYTPYQYQILEEQQNKLISKNRWNLDHDQRIALYKFRNLMNCCLIDMIIDIAPEYEPTSKYQATL